MITRIKSVLFIDLSYPFTLVAARWDSYGNHIILVCWVAQEIIPPRPLTVERRCLLVLSDKWHCVSNITGERIWYRGCECQSFRTDTLSYTFSWIKTYIESQLIAFFVCLSTWLTISFQSFMSLRLHLLLSVYSVRLKAAAAPHSSSSLSDSLIVTSPWARWFKS